MWTETNWAENWTISRSLDKNYQVIKIPGEGSSTKSLKWLMLTAGTRGPCEWKSVNMVEHVSCSGLVIVMDPRADTEFQIQDANFQLYSKCPGIHNNLYDYSKGRDTIWFIFWNVALSTLIISHSLITGVVKVICMIVYNYQPLYNCGQSSS